MTITFRKGARENVGLLIALAGASGSGKTFSAMRLAQGIVGPGNRFAVIDTEARRALHYADRFTFDHAELAPPFRPDTYAAAIKEADKAGYKAIVIDSMSHEWSGEGGALDWQEEELRRMAGDDWAKRERLKMAAWIKPKVAHKAMVQRLLQSRAHVIFCLRAEEKVEMVKGQDGKTQIVPKGFQPICAKDFMFEMTASFMLLPDAPGIGRPIKLQEQHRELFPATEQIGDRAGKRLAAWARGSQSNSAAASLPADAPTSGATAAAGESSTPAAAPSFTWVNGRGKTEEFSDATAWEGYVMRGIEKASPTAIKAARTRNASILAALPDRDAALRVSQAMNAKAEKAA